MDKRLKEMADELKKVRIQHERSRGAVLIRFEENHDNGCKNTDKVTLYYIPEHGRFDVTYRTRRKYHLWPQLWRVKEVETSHGLYAGGDPGAAAAAFCTAEWSMQRNGVNKWIR